MRDEQVCPAREQPPRSTGGLGEAHRAVHRWLRRGFVPIAAVAMACSAAPANKVAGSQAREAIFKLLSDQKYPLAAAVKDGTLTQVVAPELGAVELYRVEKFNPTRPLVFVVGYLPAASQAWVLTAQPDAWNEMVRRAGVRVTDAAGAVALARLYHEGTRNQGRRQALVESVDRVPWRPNLEPAESATKEAAIASLRPQIQPPVATPVAGGGFSVAAWAIQGMQLVKLALLVSPEGVVQASVTPVRADLPLVYAN